jgi:hypothetical protein
MLTLPEIASKTLLAIASLPDARLHVYPGLPDGQDWMGQALTQSQVCGAARGVKGLQAFSSEPLGAPYGPDTSRSVRVARVTGVVVDGATPPRLRGVAIAHGCCSARWKNSVEGIFLVLEFQAPSAFGWGAGKDSLALEQLQVRCLLQYKEQGRSVIEGVAGAQDADGVMVEFAGDWDESTVLLRRGLAQACVTRWAELACGYQLH